MGPMQPLQSQLAVLAVDFLRLCVWWLLLLAVFVPLERMWAVRPQKVWRKDFAIDLLYYFLSGLLPKLVLMLPLTLLAAALHGGAASGFYGWMASLPLGVRLAGALLVGEAGGYWGHRWSHEIPFLWRFHVVHHSAEEMDWLVNSRAHPVDLVFVRLCSLVPMYLLGLAQPLGDRLDIVPMLVTVAGTFWGFFIHANVNWRFGGLERLVSTPAFHHWHHTNDAPAVTNKNYASLLPWMDKCFGTYYLPAKEWPTRYGVDPEREEEEAMVANVRAA